MVEARLRKVMTVRKTIPLHTVTKGKTAEE